MGLRLIDVFSGEQGVLSKGWKATLLIALMAIAWQVVAFAYARGLQDGAKSGASRNPKQTTE